ncbi:MAG: hypothetical protein ACTSVB_06665 [Candidatus Heimdallarchaeaceae archaeon]
MSKTLNKDGVLLAGILLSGGQDRCFNDIELSKKLSIKREKLLEFLNKNKIDELRETKIREIKCDCGTIVAITEGINFGYCKRCNKKISPVPFRNFCLDIEKTIQNFKNKLLQFLDNPIISKEENDKLLLNWNNYKIALLLSVETINLNDLYILKGWAKEYNPDFHILVGFKPEFTLSVLYSRGDVGLLTVEKIFNITLFNKEIKHIKRSLLERQKELKLELSYKKSKDLSYIKNFWKNIIDNIEIYALQKGDESAKLQGEKFQEYVIDLLRITIFNAKWLGGKNQPDGVIFILRKNKKSLLIPLEIKSQNKRLLLIQKHEPQIRKYLSAYKNEFITNIFRVQYFIVFGYDFDLNNKKDKQVINSLESEFNVKIVLFPLKSLIHLVKLYFEYKIAIIDNDKIEDLFKNRYVREQDIENLMSYLKQITEEREGDLFKKTQELIKSSGY